MKIEKYLNFRLLRSYQLYSILSLVFSIWLVAKPIKGELFPAKDHLATSKAKVLAYQVAQIMILKSKEQTDFSTPQRNPSSEASVSQIMGEIGKDPEGNAYDFKVIEDSENLTVEIRNRESSEIQTSVRIPQKKL